MRQDANSAMSSENGHLVPLPGTEWQLWRWAALRGAGFPAHGVLRLAASPELISASDAVVNATKAIERSKEKARQEIDVALDELKATGQWNDKRKRRALFNARTRISAGKTFSGCNTDFPAAIHELESARSAYRTLFSAFQARSSEVIRDIVKSADFREAVAWQNPTALHNVLHPILSQNGSSGGSTQRQRAELVASYWQRYCTKNDTIGFFGPVGWARFAADAGHLVSRPGRQLIEVRKTYWESWAIQALGAVIGQKEEVQQWIAPLLMPAVRIEGTMLHHPLFGSMQIGKKHAALLQACDGRDVAKQIASRLLASPGKLFQSESEIYAALRQLANKQILFWKFNIPLCAYPERVLREALQQIEDAEIREPALAWLNEFDLGKKCVEAAAGDADRFVLAYQNLEHTFIERTGLPPYRHKGKSYAGRTLVYEDCRRDIEVLLGPELLRSLSGPLSLLLTAGRWFTTRVAAMYKRKLLEIHSELACITGQPSVDAATYFGRVAPLFFDQGPALLEPLEEEFRDKWERILQFGTGAGPVRYSCEELHENVMQEFPASAPGWARACYHSPDIMIAAAGEEAIRRGDYFFVMGELHVSVNTLSTSLFVNQHPRPQDLLDAVARDLGPFDIVPIWSNAEILGSRTAFSLIPASNYQLEYAGDSFALDRSRALPVSAMVLDNEDGELIARTRDNTIRAKVIDVVGRLISAGTADCLRVIARRRHTPRISIDRLVIKRESWRFSAAELSFAQCANSAERFLQTRIWAQEQGIPRFIFFKVPMEKPPTYIDLNSPILVDIFTKMIRRTSNEVSPEAMINISEMLPTTDQIWLADASNQKYTSEFRFVAVDASAQRQRARQANV